MSFFYILPICAHAENICLDARARSKYTLARQFCCVNYTSIMYRKTNGKNIFHELYTTHVVQLTLYIRSVIYIYFYICRLVNVKSIYTTYMRLLMCVLYISLCMTTIISCDTGRYDVLYMMKNKYHKLNETNINNGNWFLCRTKRKYFHLYNIFLAACTYICECINVFKLSLLCQK